MGAFDDDDLLEFQELVEELKFHGTCFVEKATAISDGSNGYESEWSVIGQIPCNVEVGSLIYQADTLYTTGEEPAAIIEISFKYDVKPPDRIKHKNDDYEVVTIEPPGDLSMVRRLGVVKRSF